MSHSKQLKKAEALTRAAAARAVLKATKGRFTKVLYANAAGETRTYTVRIGVKKHPPNFAPHFRPLGVEGPIQAYCLTVGNVGYRSLIPERILGIRCGNLGYGILVG